MDAVKAALDPLDFMRRFDAAARARGFRPEPLTEVGGVPLCAYTRRAKGPHPRVYLSSGVHGDEPAPPPALLHMLEGNLFDNRATWFLCPLLNPTGYHTASRENAQGIDLNRDYLAPRSTEITAHVRWLQRQPLFDLTICLHEDWETTGFYLYELNPDNRPSLAPVMLDAVRSHGAIESAAVIDGREAHAPGIIRPTQDPLLREQWAEAIYLARHHTRLSYTLESPSVQPLAARIAMHHAAVAAALESFSG